MICQLRTYEIFDTNNDAFHARFRDRAMRIIGVDGFEFAGSWETASPEERTEFFFLLRWPDEEMMRRQWESCMVDEKGTRITRETNAAHGDQVGKIKAQAKLLADFSPAV
jgi:heme-degrading monooxygenase HmoA